MLKPLKIKDDFVIYAENELEPFISHLDHCTILDHARIDVGLRDASKFPEMVEGKCKTAGRSLVGNQQTLAQYNSVTWVVTRCKTGL
jgi:hypothetical protein